MRKVLITGFDPFGGETINPAFEAVKLLPDQILDAQIIKLEVPTVFGKGPQKTVEAIEKERPGLRAVHRTGRRTFPADTGICRHQLCTGPHPRTMKAISRSMNRWLPALRTHISRSCRSTPWWRR